MEVLALALLGLIALSSLAQSLILIGLAREGLRIARRLGGAAERLGADLRPALDDLSRAGANLARVSELTAAQARRIDDLVADTREGSRKSGWPSCPMRTGSWPWRRRCGA